MVPKKFTKIRFKNEILKKFISQLNSFSIGLPGICLNFIDKTHLVNFFD